MGKSDGAIWVAKRRVGVRWHDYGGGRHRSEPEIDRGLSNKRKRPKQ
jgi:hypothetical protein